MRKVMAWSIDEKILFWIKDELKKTDGKYRSESHFVEELLKEGKNARENIQT